MRTNSFVTRAYFSPWQCFRTQASSTACRRPYDWTFESEIQAGMTGGVYIYRYSLSARRRLSTVSQKDRVNRRGRDFDLADDMDDYSLPPPASCYDTRCDLATYSRPPPPPPPAPPSATARTYDYTASTQV